MEVTTVRLLLADPPTSRTSTTYNQRMRSRRNLTYRQKILLHRRTLNETIEGNNHGRCACLQNEQSLVVQPSETSPSCLFKFGIRFLTCRSEVRLFIVPASDDRCARNVAGIVTGAGKPKYAFVDNKSRATLELNPIISEKSAIDCLKLLDDQFSTNF